MNIDKVVKLYSKMTGEVIEEKKNRINNKKVNNTKSHIKIDTMFK